MSANAMSLREAVEVVQRHMREIEVTTSQEVWRDQVWIDRQNQLRALSILAAAVEAHEAACVHLDHADGGTSKTAGLSFRALERLRALERGE
jgi:hypothetical protein